MLIFAFYTVFFASVFNSKKCHLFSDAEILKYVLEDGVGGDFADDVGEVMDGFAEVLGNEVAGEVGGEAVLYAVNGSEGLAEGCEVARVGDDGVIS